MLIWVLELRYENLENLYCKFRNVSDNLKVGSTEIIFIAILQDLLEGTEAAAGVCSVKKGTLKNFAKFTGKQLCLRPATLLKKSLWHVFSCEFYEIFKKTFFYRTHGCFWRQFRATGSERNVSQIMRLYEIYLKSKSLKIFRMYPPLDTGR